MYYVVNVYCDILQSMVQSVVQSVVCKYSRRSSSEERAIRVGKCGWVFCIRIVLYLYGVLCVCIVYFCVQYVVKSAKEQWWW